MGMIFGLGFERDRGACREVLEKSFVGVGAAGVWGGGAGGNSKFARGVRTVSVMNPFNEELSGSMFTGCSRCSP